MMPNISLIIDNVRVQVPQGTTVLEAARCAHIRIPTLCHMKELNEIGACRICVVDAGGRTLQPACVLVAQDGMDVKTGTPAVREARRTILQLILSTHDKNCLTCVRSQNCELQKLALELGVEDDHEFDGAKVHYGIDSLSHSVVRDNNKCILCRRCVSACRHLQACAVVGPTGRGFDTAIAAPWQLPLGETACIGCGQCIAVCPVGALYEKDDVHRVNDLLNAPGKVVVAQTAPAVRAALGEAFGLPMGTNVEGKMPAALKRLGFDRVFDTDFAADLTIMEEANELIERITSGGVLPLITSCSPGWVSYCETWFPQFIPNLSSCKSPHEMMGAMVKSYYALKMGVDPADIAVVSVMPCTAKKAEAARPELAVNGLADVDAVITTREMARMIKAAGIDFARLPDEAFDDMMGEGSGAAAIFGATGGVMEAALRTAAERLTGKPLESVAFHGVRGTQGVKEASITIGDLTLQVAVVSGTVHAKALLESVARGEKSYHFIEVMGCPGGCVTGGGQPIVSAQDRIHLDPGTLRAQALYRQDSEMTLRKSHENKQVLTAYRDFLGEVGGSRAHALLHTHYHARPLYKARSH